MNSLRNCFYSPPPFSLVLPFRDPAPHLYRSCFPPGSPLSVTRTVSAESCWEGTRQPGTSSLTVSPPRHSLPWLLTPGTTPFACIFLASPPLSPRPLSTLSPSTPFPGDLPESVILRSFCWPGAPSFYLQLACPCDCRWHGCILKVFPGADPPLLVYCPDLACLSPWTPGVMVTPSCRLFSIKTQHHP